MNESLNDLAGSMDGHRNTGGKANRMDSCDKYEIDKARVFSFGKGSDFALVFEASMQMTGTESALIYPTVG